jgi:hypothetical protein
MRSTYTMPVIDPELLRRGLYELHQLVPREVDHRALETLAVGKPFFFFFPGGFPYNTYSPLTPFHSGDLHFRGRRLHVLGNKTPEVAA